MLKVTLFLQRTTSCEDDDLIRMFEDEDHRGMIRVVYSTPELKNESSFYLSTTKAGEYVHDLLKTLRHDAEPFEHIQVTTSIHPSIMYHVASLDCPDIRYLIEETVEAALRQEVFRGPRTQ